MKPRIFCCPFCGAKGAHIDVLASESGTRDRYWVVCPECNAKSGAEPDITAAIRRWNRRKRRK